MSKNTKILLLITIFIMFSFLLIGCSKSSDDVGESELTIEEINELISGSLGEGEEFTSIEINDGNIVINVNLNYNEDDILPESELAYMRTSSITDELLESDDWNSVKIIFEGFGEILLNYDQHESNETGDLYFDYMLIENTFEE